MMKQQSILRANMMRWPWGKKPEEPVRPPKVGGTRVPDQVIRIDFSKPHDFYCRFSEPRTERVFRACILLGFSTPVEENGVRGRGGLGEGFGEWGHDRWLVLKYPDGRLVYVPREVLLYVEETPKDGKAPD
jgi:hypothetical protein